jgi:hypothetical protein
MPSSVDVARQPLDFQNNSPAAGVTRWAADRALVACWIFDSRAEVKVEATVGAGVSDSILNVY